MTRAATIVYGSGPTAVFAFDVVRRSDSTVRLAGDFRNASINPVETPHGPVTLVPVFPPTPPPRYPPGAPQAAQLDVSRFGDSAWADHLDSTPESLLSAVAGNRDGRAMSAKQFGDGAKTRPMAEVQRKIARAYHSTGGGRQGYLEGLSPYFPPMQAVLASATPTARDIVEWDLPHRRVRFDGDDDVTQFDRLVYTGSIGALIRALGVPIEPPERVEARFTLLEAARPVEMNRLVYDLRRESPVFRVFTPVPRIALVQHSLMSSAGASLSDATAELLGTDFVPLGETVTLPGAYPVDSLTPDDEAALDHACRQAGVERFGRNATARYLDLHELAWHELEIAAAS